MNLPVREQILQALALRVGAVRYTTSFDAEQLPITALVAGEDAASDPDYEMTRLVMPVQIARAVQRTGLRDDAWQTEANTLLADLVAEAWSSDDTLGGLAEGMDLTGQTAEAIDEGATGVAAQISIDIRYQFVHGNPYQQEVI